MSFVVVQHAHDKRIGHGVEVARFHTRDSAQPSWVPHSSYLDRGHDREVRLQIEEQTVVMQS